MTQTTGKQAHTPIDSARLRNSDSSGSGGQADGNTTLTLWNGSTEVMTARLDTIVRAVNHHEELVSALESALSAKQGDWQNGSGWEKKAKAILAKLGGAQ